MNCAFITIITEARGMSKVSGSTLRPTSICKSTLAVAMLPEFNLPIIAYKAFGTNEIFFLL